MKLRIVVFTLTYLLTATGFAQTKEQQSQMRWSFYKEINDVIYSTASFHKKPIQERLELIKKAKATEKRAEDVFKNSARECAAAAIGAKFYLLDMHDLALALENKKPLTNWVDLTAGMFKAVSYGQSLAECRTILQTLDAKAGIK